MIKFTFWVTCEGWKEGGYKNTHYAETKEEAMQRIKAWNDNYGREVIKLLSIEEVSQEDFEDDYIGI